MYLAIETSHERASLALFDGGGLIAETPIASEGPAREVAASLRSLLGERGRSLSELRAIAVGMGPGSYTGSRVAVTTAKTLGFARRLPVLAESSLAILAEGVVRAGGVAAGDRVRAVLDARRGAVFTAAFEVAAGGEARELGLRRCEADRVVALERLAAEVSAESPVSQGDAPVTVHLVGAGSELLLGALRAFDAIASLGASGPARPRSEPPVLRRADRGLDAPAASSLASLVRERIGAAAFDAEQLHALAPRYLQASRPELLRAAAAQRGEETSLQRSEEQTAKRSEE